MNKKKSFADKLKERKATGVESVLSGTKEKKEGNKEIKKGVSFNFNKKYVLKLKIISTSEGKSMTDILEDLISKRIDEYEKKYGEIPLPQ